MGHHFKMGKPIKLVLKLRLQAYRA